MARKFNIKNGNTGTYALYGLVLALVLFLYFNISTSLETFDVMLGNTGPIHALVLAFCLLDFLGLVRVVTPDQDMKDEPAVVWITFGIWLLASTIDILFTTWWVYLQMADNLLTIPEAVPPWLVTLFPVAVALVEFCIRVPLMLVLGMILDRKLHPQNMPTRQFKPMPQQRKTSIHRGKLSNIPVVSHGKD